MTRASVGPGPRLLYIAKAGLTKTRSIAWLFGSRSHTESQGLRLLFYHRVADDRDELAVRRWRFREQMDLLGSNGYRAVDVVEAVDLLGCGVSTERTIGLSFDDGFRDVFEGAVPVLEEHGFRATVFVATGLMDGIASFGWYRRQPPLLTWDEIVELDRAGTLRFEAHSITHPNLLALSEEHARAEIHGSKIALEERLARPVEAFCYPAGLFGARERRLVQEAGFRMATSCEPGPNLPGADPFALRRQQIDARDSVLDFRAKLAGAHDSSLPARALYRRLRYGSGRGSPRTASSSL